MKIGLWEMLREIRAGKSVQRAIQNQMFRSITVAGKVLDVAGGQKPSYRRFVRDLGAQWTIAEYLPALKPKIVFDATRYWPLRDNSYDMVFLANCLHIFADPVGILGEAARVIQPGGKVVLTVPFLWHENPEPNDYFRFTRQGLELVLKKAGLKAERIEPCAARFTAAVDLLFPYLQKLKIASLMSILAHWADRWAERNSELERKRPAPCGYLVVARKPDA